MPLAVQILQSGVPSSVWGENSGEVARSDSNTRAPENSRVSTASWTACSASGDRVVRERSRETAHALSSKNSSQAARGDIPPCWLRSKPSVAFQRSETGSALTRSPFSPPRPGLTGVTVEEETRAAVFAGRLFRLFL